MTPTEATTDREAPSRFSALAQNGRPAWATVAVWVVALVFLLLPLASQMGSVQSDDVTDFLSADADSTAVASIAGTVEARDAGQVLVVYRRAEGMTTADMALVERHRRTVSGALGESSPPTPSDDGSAVFYGVSQPAPGDMDPEDAAAEFVEGVRAEVAGDHDGMTVQVTGPTAIDVDVDEVFDGINTTLLLVTVAVVAVLLIVTYRSPFLWLVPLVSVGVAAVAATAAVYLVASAAGLQVSTPSTTIMIVLVFGAGTDYALLVVSRYREELRRHVDHRRAMLEALRRAAPVVLASGVTSSLGLLCLMAAQMTNIRGLGMVGSVGIAATTVTMLTLFPALLVVASRGVFWPFVPRVGSAVVHDAGWWSLAAGTVTRAPGRTLAGSVVVLGSLSLAVLTLPNELAQLDSFTTPAESVEGHQTLADAYPEQGGRPVVIAAPEQQEATVLQVIADASGFGEPKVDGRAQGWVLIEADVAAMPDSDIETAHVLALREQLDQTAGPRALVGGPAAERIDTAAAVGDDMGVTIPLVLLVVFIVLTLLLRAVVAPLLVVGAVVLSFGAALGIGALAFEHLFGFAGAEPDLPLLCFVFLVALGVDYAIFLISRVRDNARQTDMVSATRAALTVTGPVVVSAGVVLASTFAVLMTLPYVPMVQIGFVVAIGVLLESLVIPAAVIAPLAARFGQRLWWPRSSVRLTPTSEAAPTMSTEEGPVKLMP